MANLILPPKLAVEGRPMSTAGEGSVFGSIVRLAPPSLLDRRLAVPLALIVVAPFVIGVGVGLLLYGVVAALAAFNVLLAALPSERNDRGRVVAVSSVLMPVAIVCATIAVGGGAWTFLLVGAGVAALQILAFVPRGGSLVLPISAMFILGFGLPPGSIDLAGLRGIAALLGSVGAGAAYVGLVRYVGPFREPDGRSVPETSLPTAARFDLGEGVARSIAVGIAAGLGFALGGYLGVVRDYWIPLTVVVVVQAELVGLFPFASARVLGTVVGALVGGALTVVTHDPGWLGVALAGFVILLFLFRVVNYTIYVLFLTAFVLVLIGELSSAGWVVAWARVEDTLIGSALALLTALVLHLHLPRSMARALPAGH